MKYPSIKPTLICLFVISGLFAQDVKFGKVSKEELAQTKYPQDSSASAAVLYRERKISYRYVNNIGFTVVTDVYERVKIYNKQGFKYATVSEKLYKEGVNNENLGSLKAYTYNLEKGEVVSTKLEKSGQFTTELNKFHDEKKFTMPNITEGSIIEYQYEISSPFYWSIDEIPLQYDIPILEQYVFVAVPEYLVFKPTIKGYLQVQPDYSTSNGMINYVDKDRQIGATNTKYSSSSLDYRINKTSFLMKNVPRLVEEPYVNDMDNYRSAVNYELLYVQFPNAIKKNYSTTWEEVIKNIYNNDGFGNQLNNTRYFKDELVAILAGKSGDKDKMISIFQFVQQQMNWNGNVGYNTDKGVKNAFKEKSGNTADINLMLIAMLKEAGLEANPILISTRDHGVPLFPTREGFNYVAAAVSIDSGLILLDATDKHTEPNILCPEALNWFGKLIKEDGSFTTVSVMPQAVSKEIIFCNIEINEDGNATGKMRKTYSDYNAYKFRNKYLNVKEEEYLQHLENENIGMEIASYTIQNDKVVGKPVMENYEFTMADQVSKIGDKMYLSPLFHFVKSENPFKLDERNYPIDFSYPWEEKYVVNIAIPEGYEVTEKPGDVNLALPDDLGSFVYMLEHKGKSLQLMTSLKINQAIIPASEYALLKELYKKVVEKETEKVVLSKITSNGDKKSTTGGR